MRLVEQYIIRKGDPRYAKIDAAAFASKNLWNAANYIDMLQYKAALVGITVIITEESYTSKASFLDRDPLPTYDPERTEGPRFSGRRKGRWYYASGKRAIHSDVNGSYNIGRKAFSTAFDGREIEAPAVRPIRLAVK
jgi:putative transposase